MSVVICAKCESAYDPALAGTAACPRCTTVAELLAAAAALHSRVKSEIERSSNRLRVAVVRRDEVQALVDRAGRAIEKARTL